MDDDLFYAGFLLGVSAGMWLPILTGYLCIHICQARKRINRNC